MNTFKTHENIDKVLYTVTEVAEALSLGRTKVYDLLNRGEIESVSIGSARRITRHALEEYVRRLIGDRT